MRKRFTLNAVTRKIAADMITPVSIYLRIRDRYPRSILLESTDYQPNENCFSYICFDPLAGFEVARGKIDAYLPDGTAHSKLIEDNALVLPEFKEFFNSFAVNLEGEYDHICNGIFGYAGYDAVQYFEDIKLYQPLDETTYIPEISYHIYRYIIAINHYRHETFLIENCPGSESSSMADSELDDLEHVLNYSDIPRFRFRTEAEERSNFTDAEHLQMIADCKKHVYRGDVFQIVPSRRFEQNFSGDDFNVYRALRAINPSPYLFYYDCGSYRIFGSSPEAELIVRDRLATIYPIAGTYKRSGDAAVDEEAVERLKLDPKENAEHVMLVDLARNDLSIHCDRVEVESFKEVHHYSHVIHLVSSVTGTMKPEVNAINLLADTFPAGTLSGAPKYRAMELIDKYEKGRRGPYGGAIGYIGFNGNSNHAIVIRSFLSKDNTLYRQAGGGVVADSVPESEVQEVNNKLQALKRALEMAEEF